MWSEILETMCVDKMSVGQKFNRPENAELSSENQKGRNENKKGETKLKMAGKNLTNPILQVAGT